MDHSQHYQPLSYALHPPQTSTTPKPAAAPAPATSRADEELEEEENVVADHLNMNDHASDSPAKPPGITDAGTHQFIPAPGPGEKRRPGRPRGSKNKKIQPPALAAPPAQPTQPTQPNPAPSAPPPQFSDVNPQNQGYYEFQWKVLNLCAEFYGAAEELVKVTPPLVIAQCYQMGPGSKVDPLVMLNEAKRMCDTLLANPSQLITSPPPALYPVVPQFYHPQPVASTSGSAPPPTATAPSAATPTAKPTPAPPPPPTTVITNPGTFVVPLGTQPPYPYANYATPYYPPYSYAPGSYFQPPPPQSQPTVNPQAQASTSTPTPNPPTTATVIPAGIFNSGQWSDQEIERLKKLAEESKSTSTGEIDWERVVGEWGSGRSRHQILLKATGLGLKESSTRLAKRRREGDDADASANTAAPPNPATLNSAATIRATSNTTPPSNTTGTASPAMSHATSSATPHASPAMHNLQHPQGAKTQGRPSPPKQVQVPPPTTAMPWPMPTVASATVSPVLSPSEQRTGAATAAPTSYYRPRPAATVTDAARQYVYQNGAS